MLIMSTEPHPLLGQELLGAMSGLAVGTLGVGSGCTEIGGGSWHELVGMGLIDT